MKPSVLVGWVLGLLLLENAPFSAAQGTCDSPIVTVQQGFTTVTEISPVIGSRVTLTCVPEFTMLSPPGVTAYLWEKNGLTIEGPGTVSQLSINPIETSDGGLYRCGVNIACSSETVYSPNVTINTPADITELKDVSTGGSSTTVTEGESFQLSCIAVGWPQPSIEWLHPNGSLVETGDVYTNPSPSLFDTGNYTCRAVNRQIDNDTHPVLVEALVQVPTTVASLPSFSTSSAGPGIVLPTATQIQSQVVLSTPYISQQSQVVLSTPTPSISLFPPLTPTEDDKDKTPSPLVVFIAVIAFVGVLIIFTVLLMILVLWLGFRDLRKRKPGSGPRIRGRGTRQQVSDEIKLLEQGPDGQEETDGRREGVEAGAVLNITQQSAANQAFTALGGDEGSRATSGEVELTPLQRHSLNMDTPHKGSGEARKGATPPSAERAPPSTSIDGATRKEERRPSHKGEGEQEVKVRVRKEEGKTPRSASMGDPKGARRQKEGRERQRQRMSAARETNNTPVPAKSPQKAEKGKAPVSRERSRGRERVGPREMEGQGERERVKVKRRSQPDGADGKAAQRMARAKARRSAGEEVARKQHTEARLQQKALATHSSVAAAPATKPGPSKKKPRKKRSAEPKMETQTASLVITEQAGEVIVAMEAEVSLEDEEPPSSDEEVQPAPAKMWEQDEEEEEEEEEEVKEDLGKGEPVEKEEERDEEEEEEEEESEVKGQAEGEEVTGKEDDEARMSVFIEKAKKLGRTVSFVKQLDRSHPLTLPQIQDIVLQVDSSEEDQGHVLLPEYNSVPHNTVQTLPQSPAEKQKNRYRNVLPNPHSAVELSDTGEEASTYINANFIRGFGGKEMAYISTQGPLENTMMDFWRMVWEHNVSIIVMTTGLVERGTIKCTRYWPPAHDNSPVIYGDIVVRNNFEENTAFYKIAYLTVYPKDRAGEPGAERDVYHFWYTAWPDFGVPRESISILRLREAVNTFRETDTGPLLVHCSAGLGRSGTFMAIDMGIQQFESEGVVDPLKYMCEMRQDRGGTVQTPAQYVYIHRALGDYMASR